MGQRRATGPEYATQGLASAGTAVIASHSSPHLAAAAAATVAAQAVTATKGYQPPGHLEESRQGLNMLGKSSLPKPAKGWNWCTQSRPYLEAPPRKNRMEESVTGNPGTLLSQSGSTPLIGGPSL